MTLPFRRRHNDAEASHDRARSIMATGFLEPTAAADDAWLETHLSSCPECRAELIAFQGDRELLRALREQAPEPPRDLWARTAASIEREAGRHGRAARPAVAPPRRLRLPLGVMSGVLVILVVIGTSLMPGKLPPVIDPTSPRQSDVAVATPPPEATPLAVTAHAVTWVEEQSDGSFQLVSADVSEVCTSNPEACAPIADESTTRITLPSEPEAVVLSPASDQLVVVSKATPAGGGEIIIVPVPTPSPAPGATPAPTVTPSPTPIVTPTPALTVRPGDTPIPTSLPTQSPDPGGSYSILSDVIVVGDAAYSADGQWLAFSARPLDGASGPDLYLWRVGEAQATAVTADHRTFFAGWLGSLILASRVEPVGAGEPGASPDASAEPAGPAAPTAGPAASTKPARTPRPGPKGSPTPDASGDPSTEASPEASPDPAQDHPVSFLYDPATQVALDLAGDDIWRPVVDSASGTIVYWSGTLVPDETGTGWAMGAGRLVIDGWVDPAMPAPAASTVPGASPTTFSIAPSLDPLASPVPTPPPGPAGTPTELAAGPISDFEASFDPSGTRLAVWTLDPASPFVGTLRLITIDADTGQIQSDVDPLPGVAALRGFSIGEGRLAWVTPPGQDGESSHVQVLAWDGDDFGQVRSIAADRFFVVR